MVEGAHGSLNMADIAEYDCQQLSDYLLSSGIREECAAAFTDNMINGEAFFSLSEEDLKELLPVIGDRILIRKLLKKLSEEHNHLESSTTSVPQTTSNNTDVNAASTDVEDTSYEEIAVDTQTANISTVEADNPNPDWHLNFAIPDLRTFSASVRDAVRTGVIEGRARREIIQVLRTYVTAHTVNPTSEQYKAVCRALVTKYPNLKDGEVGKSSFGSWKLGLRNSFKNFRKKLPKENKKKAKNSLTGEPSSKRLKLCNEDEPDIDNEEYEEALDQLREEHKKILTKKGGSYGEVRRLMEKTKLRRRQWIKNEEPLVSEVVQKFPCLASMRYMRQEFKEIVSFEANINSLMETWPSWCHRIISFAKLEAVNRPFIKKLLETLEDTDEDLHHPEDHRDVVCLDLLTRLLFPRGMGKSVVFIKKIETSDVDLDEAASEVQQSAPYLVITGIPGSMNCQVFISCEQEILYESSSVKDSIIDLIGMYFVFNISYPKYLNSLFLFFQHYVFNLKDKQPVPMTTLNLVRNLQKLD